MLTWIRVPLHLQVYEKKAYVSIDLLPYGSSVQVVCSQFYFAQTITGFYLDRANEAWEWFSVSVVPSLTLIAGVFFSRKRISKDYRIEKRIFGIAVWLSVLHLLAVNLTVYLSPFSPVSPLNLMSESKLWLGISQGFVTAALGVFFVSEPELNQTM